jgi:hypothetical protein
MSGASRVGMSSISILLTETRARPGEGQGHVSTLSKTEKVIAERAVLVAQRSCAERAARERRTLGATATSASVRTVAIGDS